MSGSTKAVGFTTRAISQATSEPEQFYRRFRDLAAQGFPLAGGRLDYIAQHAVAVLDYRRKNHVINVFVWPAKSGAVSADLAVTHSGFNLQHWSADGMSWWAVSDLNTEELKIFMQLLRSPQT